MKGFRASRLFPLFAALLALLPSTALAHPGSGIVVDRHGNVYFVDMVSGVWKVDPRGTLTHLPGPGFHWMTIDESSTLGRATLPRGAAGDIVRLGTQPTLLLSSDVPVTLGRDGNLYYPARGPQSQQLLRLIASGSTSTVGRLFGDERAAVAINDLAVGPAGFYFTENAAVRRLDASGTLSTVAEGVRPAGCAAIAGIDRGSGPLLRGLAVDSAGSIYVAATGCGSVLRITPAGIVTKILQVDDGWSPTGIALAGSDVYVLEFLGAGSDDRRAMIPRVRRIGGGGASRIIATVSR